MGSKNSQRPLAQLINHSLNDGFSLLKLSEINPIYKEESAEAIEKYRPIQ